MKKTSFQNGFILPLTIILLMVCSLAIAAVLSYVSFTTRMTAIHLGNSVCRLAAQSAIESAKRDIYKTFYAYSGGSSVRIGTMTGTAFDWFNSYSRGTPPTEDSPGTASTIGSGTVVTLPGTTNISGCAVTPIIHHSGRVSGQPAAVVTLRATAIRSNPGGTVSSSTIEERVRFALMRSRVFDNAYFVNNYGWFQGSSITANGDVRANGNLYLDSGCTVNGRAYAARNDELGVIGTIQNTGKMQSLSTYWSSCGTSARPSSPAYTGGGYFGGGYDPSVSVTDRLYPYQDELTMPYISDLGEYVTYAQQVDGKLSGGISYKLDANGNVTQSPLGTIHAHYNGVGPSGNDALSRATSRAREPSTPGATSTSPAASSTSTPLPGPIPTAIPTPPPPATCPRISSASPPRATSSWATIRSPLGSVQAPAASSTTSRAARTCSNTSATPPTTRSAIPERESTDGRPTKRGSAATTRRRTAARR